MTSYFMSRTQVEFYRRSIYSTTFSQGYFFSVLSVDFSLHNVNLVRTVNELRGVATSTSKGTFMKPINIGIDRRRYKDPKQTILGTFLFVTLLHFYCFISIYTFQSSFTTNFQLSSCRFISRTLIGTSL